MNRALQAHANRAWESPPCGETPNEAPGAVGGRPQSSPCGVEQSRLGLGLKGTEQFGHCDMWWGAGKGVAANEWHAKFVSWKDDTKSRGGPTEGSWHAHEPRGQALRVCGVPSWGSWSRRGARRRFFLNRSGEEWSWTFFVGRTKLLTPSPFKVISDLQSDTSRKLDILCCVVPRLLGLSKGLLITSAK